ncbi:hypothetical protein [Halosegnis sp.]|uniref:hypothetical protein n=1 Tax=Halosegnis sp. TaxID=2864959 RepID=UPI0035D4003C
MDRRFLATVAAAVVLLAAGGAVGVIVGGAGLFDRQPRVDPTVTAFNSSDARCAEAPASEPRVDAGNTTRGTFLIIRANLTVSGPDSRLKNATLAETGLANYTLTYEGAAGDGTCPDGERAVVSTYVAFQVPHRGGEPFGVTVRYRNRVLFELRNGPSGVAVTRSSA